MRGGRCAEALALAMAARERDPNDPDAVFVCALVHTELGRFAEAERLLDEVQLLARVRWFGFKQSAVVNLREIVRKARKPPPTKPRASVRKVEPVTRGQPWWQEAAPPAATPSATAPVAPPATAAVSAKAAVLEIARARPASDALATQLATSAASATTATSTADPATALTDYRLRQQAHEIERLRGYDTLLSLHAIHG